MEPAAARGVPQARLSAVAADRAQPGADAAPHLAGDADRRGADPEFLALYDAAVDALDAARSARDTWWHAPLPRSAGPIAYFSAEFALHQSLPIYAGGLGVLAGDHCKEASDLGVPLIGVGFMYPQGYFHQTVSPEGWQQESTSASTGPTRRSSRRRTPDGSPCIIAVPLGNRSVLVPRLARAVGPREALPARHRSRGERPVGSRAVGAALRRRPRDAHPAGDHPRHRRRPRAQGAGHRPAVWHLNEGHAAFVVLQRIRDLIEAGPRSKRRSRRCGARRSSRRTRRCRPATTRSRSPGRDAPRRRVGHARRVSRRVPGARPLRQRQRSAVQHDGAGAADRRRTSTASASCTARSRATCGPIWPGVADDQRPGAGDHQRRPRADVALAEMARFDEYLGRRTGAIVTTTRASGTRCSRSPTKSCGRRARRCARISSPSSASARVSAGRRARQPPRAWSPPARCSIRTR